MALAPSAYLDFNASAPVTPAAADAAAASFAHFGNPSSVHGAGRAARAVIEDAREAVAAMVGAAPANVVFTSGGTEANALALRGVAAGRATILAGAAEHPSVLAHVAPENVIPVDREGVLDLGALEARLKAAKAPVHLALMLANNETGALQPVKEAATLVHAHGGLLHCDAVQGPGKMKVDLATLGADSLALSAHKFGGLKGAGALILRAGFEPTAILPGGGQERRRRAGTENVSGIAAFGAAARGEPSLREKMPAVAALRDALETALLKAAPRARIFASAAARLGNTICVALPGVSSEIQVMRLDLAGVAVSAGAACSSGKIAPSHVLLAMGISEAEAKTAIRISLGWTTTREDNGRFMACWQSLASGAAA